MNEDEHKQNFTKDLKAREEIVRILEDIIENNTQQIEITKLIADTQLLESLLTFLQFFNVIDFSTDSTFKVKSDIALNFLKSLKIYIHENLQLISNWDLQGAESEEKTDHLYSGVQFLYEMEKKRTEKLGSKEFIEELNI